MRAESEVLFNGATERLQDLLLEVATDLLLKARDQHLRALLVLAPLESRDTVSQHGKHVLGGEEGGEEGGGMRGEGGRV